LAPPKADKPPLGVPRKRPKDPIHQPQSENPALHDKHVQLLIMAKYGCPHKVTLKTPLNNSKHITDLIVGK
jgi:hypothetical protein